MGYDVSTPVFEGPFDLLLHLINQEQVDIHEVSLSAIVEGFVAHVERMEAIDLDLSSEFLLIAAVLIELKARRLLPGSSNADLDDELALWEERDLLLSRLLECKTFKDAAGGLSRLAAAAERSVARRVGPDDRYRNLLPDLLAGVSPDRLRRALIKAMSRAPVPRVDLSHVAPIRVTVADAAERLIRELGDLSERGPVSFRQLVADRDERIEVIVCFLAVLELYKQGLIELDQAASFGDLLVTWVGDDGSTGPIGGTAAGDGRATAVAAVDAYLG